MKFFIWVIENLSKSVWQHTKPYKNYMNGIRNGTKKRLWLYRKNLYQSLRPITHCIQPGFDFINCSSVGNVWKNRIFRIKLGWKIKRTKRHASTNMLLLFQHAESCARKSWSFRFLSRYLNCFVNGKLLFFNKHKKIFNGLVWKYQNLNCNKFKSVYLIHTDDFCI